jgi:hypothetical protein
MLARLNCWRSPPSVCCRDPMARSGQRQRRNEFNSELAMNAPTPGCVGQRSARCTIDIRYAYPAAELLVVPAEACDLQWRSEMHGKFNSMVSDGFVEALWKRSSRWQWDCPLPRVPRRAQHLRAELGFHPSAALQVKTGRAVSKSTLRIATADQSFCTSGEEENTVRNIGTTSLGGRSHWLRSCRRPRGLRHGEDKFNVLASPTGRIAVRARPVLLRSIQNRGGTELALSVARPESP